MGFMGEVVRKVHSSSLGSQEPQAGAGRKEPLVWECLGLEDASPWLPRLLEPQFPSLRNGDTSKSSPRAFGAISCCHEMLPGTSTASRMGCPPLKGGRGSAHGMLPGLASLH